MEIISGDYALCSDRYCVWVERRTISKTGKDYAKNVSGYHRTFTALLKSFALQKLRSSEHSSIKEIVAQMADMEKSILAIAEQAGEMLDKRLEEEF